MSDINEAKRIGNIELERLVEKAEKLANDIPTSSKKLNELEKYNKELYRKLYQANNIIQQFKKIKKEVPTLRDMDDKGRALAKRNLEKLIKELEKYSKEVGLGKVDAAIVSAKNKGEETGRVKVKKDAWKEKVKGYMPKKAVAESVIDKEKILDVAYEELSKSGVEVGEADLEKKVNKVLKKASSEKEAIKSIKELLQKEAVNA
jgi:hypothetical protein